MQLDEKYWTGRYIEGNTQWDVGEITTPLKEYTDQLSNKNLKILLPGAGNAYEAEYLFHRGFRNIYIVDLSPVPLRNFLDRNPDFPAGQLLQMDFFQVNEKFDLILEQTFFCSLHPAQRDDYVAKCAELLHPGGKVVGVLFNVHFPGGPPYGGKKKEYFEYFVKHFDLMVFEECHNSIKPRRGRELFINCVKP